MSVQRFFADRHRQVPTYRDIPFVPLQALRIACQENEAIGQQSRDPIQQFPIDPTEANSGWDDP
jgi:hypothetical protein